MRTSYEKLGPVKLLHETESEINSQLIKDDDTCIHCGLAVREWKPMEPCPERKDLNRSSE